MAVQMAAETSQETCGLQRLSNTDVLHHAVFPKNTAYSRASLTGCLSHSECGSKAHQFKFCPSTVTGGSTVWSVELACVARLASVSLKIAL